MSRTHRLFQITQYLRQRKRVTAQQLADWLEVSQRTIYRDIQQLMLSGVPVNGEAGTGYWLESGFDFPPLMFTREELEALYIGMRMTMQCTDTRLAEAALSVLDKVDTQLPEGLRSELANNSLAMHFPIHNKEVMQTMEIMRNAIRKRRKLALEYLDEQGHSSQRTVRPLELAFWGKSWTLAGWCELREDFRHFRPDRVTAIQTLQDLFRPDESGKSLQDLYRQIESQCQQP